MDGEEALAKVATFRPDLVLLDVMMPKKSGFEVCEAVRANPDNARLLVVMLTAKGRDTEVAKVWLWVPMPTSPSRFRPRNSSCQGQSHARGSLSHGLRIRERDAMKAKVRFIPLLPSTGSADDRALCRHVDTGLVST